jgi:hypothetical protein
MGERCTATTKKGTPCKGWAVRGSDPPRCGAHGGGAARPGVPVGSQNALKHGAYSAAESLEDLERKVARLGEHLNDNFLQLVAAGQYVSLLDAWRRLDTELKKRKEKAAAAAGETDSLMGDYNKVIGLARQILGLDLEGETPDP